MPQQVLDFLRSAMQAAFSYANPLLTEFAQLQEVSLQPAMTTDEGHEHYTFDLALDDIFRAEIKRHSITGRVFSEEAVSTRSAGQHFVSLSIRSATVRWRHARSWRPRRVSRFSHMTTTG